RNLDRREGRRRFVRVAQRGFEREALELYGRVARREVERAPSSVDRVDVDPPRRPRERRPRRFGRQVGGGGEASDGAAPVVESPLLEASLERPGGDVGVVIVRDGGDARREASRLGALPREAEEVGEVRRNECVGGVLLRELLEMRDRRRRVPC